jgi:hypothetical protein
MQDMKNDKKNDNPTTSEKPKVKVTIKKVGLAPIPVFSPEKEAQIKAEIQQRLSNKGLDELEPLIMESVVNMVYAETCALEKTRGELSQENIELREQITALEQALAANDNASHNAADNSTQSSQASTIQTNGSSASLLGSRGLWATLEQEQEGSPTQPPPLESSPTIEDPNQIAAKKPGFQKRG